MACRLKTCCCGHTLRNGTKAIGIFTLVCGMLSLIRLMLFPIFSNLFKNNVSELATIEDWIFLLEKINSTPLTIILIVLSIAANICGSLLISAASKNNNRKLLVPWLIFSIIGLAAGDTVLLTIFGTILLSFLSGYALIMYSAFGICLIKFGLTIYLWLIVYSYYQELRENKQREKRDEYRGA